MNISISHKLLTKYVVNWIREYENKEKLTWNDIMLLIQTTFTYGSVWEGKLTSWGLFVLNDVGDLGFLPLEGLALTRFAANPAFVARLSMNSFMPMPLGTSIPCTLKMCCLQVPVWMKPWLQYGQTFGFSPVWICIAFISQVPNQYFQRRTLILPDWRLPSQLNSIEWYEVMPYQNGMWFFLPQNYMALFQFEHDWWTHPMRWFL